MSIGVTIHTAPLARHLFTSLLDHSPQHLGTFHYAVNIEQQTMRIEVFREQQLSEEHTSHWRNLVDMYKQIIRLFEQGIPVFLSGNDDLVALLEGTPSTVQKILIVCNRALQIEQDPSLQQYKTRLEQRRPPEPPSPTSSTNSEGAFANSGVDYD